MLKKILTKDGSYTFYNPDLKETFHSKNGALTESLHVYISEGLEYWIKNNSKVELCNIFEMGFTENQNILFIVGALGSTLVAPSRGSYVNYNTSCGVCRCRCVNNRISSPIYCKLQHFLCFALCVAPAV